MSEPAQPAVTVEDFTKLTATTSLYRPQQQKTQDANLLIVVCSWFGAAPKHVAKYTTTYSSLYPSATLLLAQSTPKSMFTGSDLAAAADVINSHSGPVVLHMFSNGGGTTAVQLAQVLPGPKRFDAVILDSCPGTADLTSATKAVAYSVPPAYRAVGSYVIWGLLLLYLIYHETLRIETGIEWMRRNLNDLALFSPKERLYLFSEADELVRSQDVQSHAAGARKLGLVVREEAFKKAAHCGLIQEDGERYWGAVKEQIGKVSGSK